MENVGVANLRIFQSPENTPPIESEKKSTNPLLRLVRAALNKLTGMLFPKKPVDLRERNIAQIERKGAMDKYVGKVEKGSVSYTPAAQKIAKIYKLMRRVEDQNSPIFTEMKKAIIDKVAPTILQEAQEDSEIHEEGLTGQLQKEANLFESSDSPVLEKFASDRKRDSFRVQLEGTALGKENSLKEDVAQIARVLGEEVGSPWVNAAQFLATQAVYNQVDVSGVIHADVLTTSLNFDKPIVTKINPNNRQDLDNRVLTIVNPNGVCTVNLVPVRDENGNLTKIKVTSFEEIRFSLFDTDTGKHGRPLEKAFRVEVGVELTLNDSNKFAFQNFTVSMS